MELKPPAFSPKGPLYNMDRLADLVEERERTGEGREGRKERYQ